ncbi:MAG: undecaprenyl-diphosphate phosphatase [Gammaproteobacteria bacterium]|nr:undecaprenyl-diphosphate phosphatase [Gammaproteobacteria bacterium]
MDWIQIIVLALVQGITEFLPVSSSAHLILVPELLGWPDQGLAFDVAVHVGALLAVVIYFQKQLRHISLACYRSMRQPVCDDTRLAINVVIATLPIVPAGLLANYFEDALRDPLVIAWTTVGFGLVLWWAAHAREQNKTEYQILVGMALAIGLAQCLALIPGTSRSGITITAGLLLGLTPVAAARFSFLLSIPVIVMAGGLKTIEWIQLGMPDSGVYLLVGAGLAAVSAGACIHIFLKLLDRIGMLPFVIYRLLLGAFLFSVFT